jgi:hypothetical protein
MNPGNAAARQYKVDPHLAQKLRVPDPLGVS